MSQKSENTHKSLLSKPGFFVSVVWQRYVASTCMRKSEALQELYMILIAMYSTA